MNYIYNNIMSYFYNDIIDSKEYLRIISMDCCIFNGELKTYILLAYILKLLNIKFSKFKNNIFILFNYYRFFYINKSLETLVNINSLVLAVKSNKFLRGELTYKTPYFLYTKRYKHQKVLSVFLSKFIRAGKKFIVEKFFFSILELKKSFYFFFYLLEALEVLRPSLNVKLFTFKQKGKKKSVKKGKRVKKRVKVIPEKVNYSKSCKLSFKWLISSILENSEGFTILDKKNSIIKEFFDIYFFSRGISMKKKKNLYKLAAKNRSSMHFRWKKSY